MKGEHAERVAELADRHGRMVFATAYRVLGCAEDAEDVLQEVFLKLLTSRNGRARAEAVRDWGAYLRVTASRCAVDLLRRKSRWKKDGAELREDVPAPADRDPRQLAIRRQRARLLRQAVGSLPKHEARVFALRYFEELPYEEIAQQAGIKVKSVGVLLHRARRRLRHILEPMLAADAGQGQPRQDRPEETEGE